LLLLLLLSDQHLLFSRLIVEERPVAFSIHRVVNAFRMLGHRVDHLQVLCDGRDLRLLRDQLMRDELAVLEGLEVYWQFLFHGHRLFKDQGVLAEGTR